MNSLYDLIGSTYTMTRRADSEITHELARLVGNEDGSRFLDLACGTGNYTSAIADSGGQWFGIDISEVMLKKAKERNHNIEWTVSRADSLPYQDRHFQGVICSLAIHHFPELISPFREVYRVLEKGNFVIFTAFPEQMQSYWLCHYFPEMMRRSIEKMPTKKSVISALEAANFEIEKITPFFVTNNLQDLFLYSGKERPNLYLDPGVRLNISSFATLCDANELEKGLYELQSDLMSGAFEQIAKKYSSTAGDYAYVVARK
jgi:ubiquinone/menaquinone biosynthesis C-methylase UbiE